ncbi:MAG: DNRLRE domain-containing protein [Acidobacteriota bacterium]|nr:MAG: DNRLRE domain-containing protein [Acidobacteriota bacterium]
MRKMHRSSAVLLTVLTTAFLLVGPVSAGAFAGKGIWINEQEIAALPTSGAAWQRLKAQADEPAGEPLLSDQSQDNNLYVLAKALVYARTGQEKYRREVIDQCMKAIGTEQGGRTLAFGRELAAYVIAADLVGLPATEDETFKAWIRKGLNETLEGRTLVSTHEDRPNNWGTHAGASRIAVAVYLGDKAELERAAKVFKGWLGDREAYSGFKYGDLSWQADSSRPVGINPKGATKSGRNIDGIVPDDQRRGGDFQWPPPKENYVWEGLQGALVQAVLLHRQGYPAFEWQDQALLRAARWLVEVADFLAVGDDTWQLPVLDYYYGTTFWDGETVRGGKNMDWTDWTHAAVPLAPPAPLATDRSASAPVIASFSPSSGPANSLVLINGQNLGSVSAVLFNGQPASEFRVSSSTLIEAYVPQGATSGFLVVSDGQNASSLDQEFLVSSDEPTVEQVTLQATADTRVNEAYPDKNYGDSDFLRIRDFESASWWTCVKFLLPNSLGTVRKATLRLYVTDEGKTTGNVFSLSNSWKEGEISWNTMPRPSGTGQPGPVDAKADTWAEFDVTQLLEGTGTQSFVLVPDSSNSVFFSSREGKYPPELQLEVEK